MADTQAKKTDKPEKAEASSASPPPIVYGDHIDQSAFEQILEMDEGDDEQTFSRSIIESFFEQAESTFKKMQQQLDRRDLDQLSNLGHFLKGSAATIGLSKVKESCEKIQNYGKHKDDSDAEVESTDDECLDKIRNTLKVLTEEYREAEAILRAYFKRSAPQPS